MQTIILTIYFKLKKSTFIRQVIAKLLTQFSRNHIVVRVCIDLQDVPSGALIAVRGTAQTDSPIRPSMSKIKAVMSRVISRHLSIKSD